MIIQNVLWPKADVCTQEEMYFRKNKFATRVNQTFVLDKHGKISSDTYFNSVSPVNGKSTQMYQPSA